MTEQEIIKKLFKEHPEGVSGKEYHEALLKADQSPEQLKMRGKMEKYKPFFADMITPETEMIYDYVLIRCQPKNFYSSWGAEFNAADFSLSFDYHSWTHRPDLSLLHEMIHMHIFVMDDAQKEQCKKNLRADLLEKIPQLDFITDYCQDYFETVPQPAHDELFFLKSLDIDLKKKYKLGQTFDYGLAYIIDDILSEPPERRVSKKILMGDIEN